MIDRVKEVDSLEGLVLDGARLGEPVEGTDTGREVVERCEVRQVAAVAAEQDLTEVDEAVDGLLDGGEDPRRRPLPMFHLAVVLEKGDVVDCRLNAEHAAVLVVHLDRGTARYGSACWNAARYLNGFAVPGGRPVKRSAWSSRARMSRVTRRVPLARIGAGVTASEWGNSGMISPFGLSETRPKGAKIGANLPVGENAVFA